MSSFTRTTMEDLVTAYTVACPDGDYFSPESGRRLLGLVYECDGSYFFITQSSYGFTTSWLMNGEKSIRLGQSFDNEEDAREFLTGIISEATKAVAETPAPKKLSAYNAAFLAVCVTMMVMNHNWVMLAVLIVTSPWWFPSYVNR